MSYCRWSDDDHRSDLYVYCMGDVFVTHVARARCRVLERPLARPLPDDASPELIVAGQMLVMEGIDHPEAGKSFFHATAAECADNLERLRAAGFHVPQHAIDSLRAEASDVASAR